MPPFHPSTTSSSPFLPSLKVLVRFLSFSTLHLTSPIVTTRTTTLTTVSHPSFSLRFSDLADTERACLEDDEERAARTIDWIGDRITRQCTHWLKELDDDPDRYATRTPWWDELARCAEGDHLPSKYDGWNHPLSSQSHDCALSPTHNLASHSSRIYHSSQPIAGYHDTPFSYIGISLLGRHNPPPLHTDRTYQRISSVRRRVRHSVSFLLILRQFSSSGLELYSMPSRNNMVYIRFYFLYLSRHPHLLPSKSLPSHFVSRHLPLNHGRMVPHLPVPIPHRP